MSQEAKRQAAIMHAPKTANTRTKVDPNTGKYLYWPGSTIVMEMMDINGVGVPLYESLANDPLVTNSLSLLPPQSYHVTLRGLFNVIKFKNDNAVNYNRHIDTIFSKLVALDQQFEREMPPTPIGFNVVPNARDGYVSLRLSAINPETEALLRKWEQQVITSVPGLKQQPQAWHLSLGYWYGDDKEARQRANRAIREHHQHVIPAQIYVHRPRVCWFHDMTEFVPI